jgi:hypothetical protein
VPSPRCHFRPSQAIIEGRARVAFELESKKEALVEELSDIVTEIVDEALGQ